MHACIPDFKLPKHLIIAEKPSVAADIARALGGFTRHDDYFESDRYVLSSAVGHLLEIGMPEEEEVKRGKWTFAHLPAIPSKFALKPIEKNESRLRTLLRLIKRKDVDRLINACDAGREGELIFRYIVQYAKTDKPIQRLWLQSMTPARSATASSGCAATRTMRPLADAAVCRSESDWLVGINGTRAMTAFNSKSGGFQLTTVGRVQTPTLAILVEREEKIRAFAPRDYWEVHRHVSRGSAASTRAAGSTRNSEGRARRATPDAPAPSACGTKREARAIADKCAGKPGIVTEESKPSTQSRAAALRPDQPAARSQRPLRLFGAHDALARAGALRKAQGADLSAHRFARAAGGLSRHGQGDAGGAARDERLLGRSPRKILKHKWVKPNKRIFDNAKISDHFAIIPDARAAEAPERSRGEALRPRRQALPRGVLSRRRNSCDHADHARRRRAVQDPRARSGRSRAGSPSTARKRRRRRARRCAPVKPGETVADREDRRRRAARPGRRRASTKRRCCPRWKAPAN